MTEKMKAGSQSWPRHTSVVSGRGQVTEAPSHRCPHLEQLHLLQHVAVQVERYVGVQ